MGGESGKSEDESRAARAFVLPAILGVVAFATLVIFAAGTRNGQEQVCTTPTYEADGTPRYESCAEMAVIEPSAPGCEEEPALVSQVLRAFGFGVAGEARSTTVARAR